MQLKIDVLPAPLGPMMAKSSPCSTWKLTSDRAVTPPNWRVRPEQSRSGPAAFWSPATSGTPALLAAVALHVAVAAPARLTEPEVRLADVTVGQEVGGGTVEDDLAVLEDVAGVGDRQRHHRVLLHQQDAGSLGV